MISETPKAPAPPAPSATAKPSESSAAAQARFRAEMPKIPGVAGGANPQGGNNKQLMRIAQILGAVVIVGCVSGWWMLRGTHAAGAAAAGEQLQTPSPAPAELPPPPIAAASPGRNEIGAIEEFPRAWAVKTFQYVSLVSRESVPAIAIRLPVGDGHSAISYWGVLLKAPFGQCDLEFVSDVNAINAKYGYHATHPMIVDSCSGIIYDPLRTGTLSDGTWSRGDIVKGTGMRPPMQVEIKVEGGHLFAGRAE